MRDESHIEKLSQLKTDFNQRFVDFNKSQSFAEFVFNVESLSNETENSYKKIGGAIETELLPSHNKVFWTTWCLNFDCCI